MVSKHRAALIILLLSLSCNREPDPGLSSERVSFESAPIPAGAMGPDAVTPAEEAATSESALEPTAGGFSCGLDSLEVLDLSSVGLFADPDRDGGVRQAAIEPFSLAGDGSGPGLAVKFIGTFYRWEADPVGASIGIKLVGRALSGSTALMWESDESVDFRLAEDCRGEGLSATCRESIVQQHVKPAARRAAARLRGLCDLEVCSPARLLVLMDDEDPRVRAGAVRAAGERQVEQALPGLRKLVRDPEETIAISAISALALLEDGGAVEAIVSRSTRASETVIRAAAVALHDIDSPLSRRYLAEWASSHPLTQIRELARRLFQER